MAELGDELKQIDSSMARRSMYHGRETFVTTFSVGIASS